MKIRENPGWKRDKAGENMWPARGENPAHSVKQQIVWAKQSEAQQTNKQLNKHLNFFSICAKAEPGARRVQPGEKSVLASCPVENFRLFCERKSNAHNYEVEVWNFWPFLKPKPSLPTIQPFCYGPPPVAPLSFTSDLIGIVSVGS